jgi:hypothetical protein
MPMIDVYTPDGVDREIAESLRRSASRRRSTRQLRSVSSYNILNSAVFDIDQTAAAATGNRLLLMLPARTS